MHRYAFAPALLALSGVLLASTPAAAAGIDKHKLVGTWTCPRPNDLALQFQFTSDGKYTRKSIAMGKTIFSRSEGTYIVTGNQLKRTWKDRDGMEKTNTLTITELTDKKLVIRTKGGIQLDFRKE